MLKGIFGALGGNIALVWVLVIMAPIYLFIGNFITNLYKTVWIFSIDRSQFVYKNLGDISWVFPFAVGKSEIRFTDTILVGILCAMLSLLIVLAMAYDHLQKKNQERLESEVRNLIDQKTK